MSSHCEPFVLNGEAILIYEATPQLSPKSCDTLNAMQKDMYVYIMTNRTHTVFYLGVTNDLRRRTYEHRNESKGFTRKYNITKLVYYEHFDNPDFAIQREKQLKGGSRRKKFELIQKFNPGWIDLDIE